LRFLFFGEEEEDSSRRRHAVDYTEGGGGIRTCGMHGGEEAVAPGPCLWVLPETNGDSYSYIVPQF